MNPLHIMAPLMATRCGGITPRQKQNPCTVLDTLHCDLFLSFTYLFIFIIVNTSEQSFTSDSSVFK